MDSQSLSYQPDGFDEYEKQVREAAEMARRRRDRGDSQKPKLRPLEDEPGPDFEDIPSLAGAQARHMFFTGGTHVGINMPSSNAVNMAVGAERAIPKAHAPPRDQFAPRPRQSMQHGGGRPEALAPALQQQWGLAPQSSAGNAYRGTVQAPQHHHLSVAMLQPPPQVAPSNPYRDAQIHVQVPQRHPSVATTGMPQQPQRSAYGAANHGWHQSSSRAVPQGGASLDTTYPST